MGPGAHFRWGLKGRAVSLFETMFGVHFGVLLGEPSPVHSAMKVGRGMMLKRTADAPGAGVSCD